MRFVTLVTYGNDPEGVSRQPSLLVERIQFKVNAKIGATKADQRYMLSVIDTGAGPHLIREGCAPPESLRKMVTTREIVNLTSASNNRLDVLGLVTFTVTVGSYSARVLFAVVRNLGADILLRVSYQLLHVENICPRKRIVELPNGDIVTMTMRQALKPVATELSERKLLGNRSLANYNAIRVARTTVLPRQLEELVDVTSHQRGLCIIESRPDMWEQK